MGWPKRWVFVRHAESEGNVLTPEERTKVNKSTHLYELTERGKLQAQITGDWLRKHFGYFDVYYSSYYTRAVQTLELMYPDVKRYDDSRLAEAQRGIYHVLTDAEVAKMFPWEAERKRRRQRKVPITAKNF